MKNVPLLIGLLFLLGNTSAQTEILGCTDEHACNFNPEATSTDPFQCTYDCYGCMDSLACNYDSLATMSDGYCYNNDLGCGCDEPAPTPGFDCFGNCLDLDSDGECDETFIFGCTDSTAFNYDASATADDGSCQPVVLGCMDDSAENYQSDANVDDGNCLLIGCTDSLALNYSNAFNLTDNSCIYVTSNACEGRYLNKIFDQVEMTTVTYSSIVNQQVDIYQALNDTTQQNRPLIIYVHGGGFLNIPGADRSSYHASVIANEFAKRGYVVASIDYRLMEIAELTCGGLCGELLIPSDFTNYTHDHITQAYMDTKAAVRFFRKTIAEGNPYRIDGNHFYMGGHSAGGVITNHMFFEQEDEIGSNHMLYDEINEQGGFLGNSGNNGFSSEINGAFNLSGAVFHLDVIDEQDTEKPYISVHGTADEIVPYENGMFFSDLWWFPFASSIFPSGHGSGTINSTLTSLNGTNHYHLAFPGGGHNFEPSASYWGDGAEDEMIQFVSEKLYPYLPCSVNEIIGCTDSLFINFDPAANLNNENCTDSLSFGCTNPTASNYSPVFNTDDGSCLDIEGCTDSLAFNFQSNALTDDGSCISILLGCTNSNYFEFDPLANTENGSCVNQMISGCMDSTSYNFNSDANVSDDSCVPFVQGCTEESAENYNPTANTDDNTCIILGCQDNNAVNYSPQANQSDLSCYYLANCTDTIFLDTAACDSYSWQGAEYVSSGSFYADLFEERGQPYQGVALDANGINTIVLGQPSSENGLGSVSVLEYNGSEWIQKGQTLVGTNLDLADAQDNFGFAVALGDENVFAASSIHSDDSYEVCGDWELVIEWQCPAWPFWCPGWVTYPYIPCSDVPVNDKGVVNIYEWNGNQWTQKGESIWGQYEYDESGDNLIMPDANTIAISSSNSGTSESGAIGHIRVFSWQNDAWEEKGNPIYGDLYGDFVGNLMQMPHADTMYVAFEAQHKISQFTWDGLSWESTNVELTPEELILDFSMQSATVVALATTQDVRIYDLENDTWVQRGPSVVCEQCSVEVGDENTFVVSDGSMISLYRWQGNQWVKKTDKIHSNEGIKMNNPNFVFTNNAAFEFVNDSIEDGCELTAVLNVEVNSASLMGCTDYHACNYDASLICDDGSCEYLPGDFNGDLVISVSDMLLLLAEFDCYAPAVCETDLDGSGFVSVSDLLMFLSYFGTACED